MNRPPDERCARHGRVARRLASAFVVGVLSTGCASAPVDPAALPTPEQGEQALSPRDIPIDFRRIQGDGFTIGVPGAYEEAIVVYPNGVTVSQWSEPHPGAPLSTAVTVVREGAPAMSADQQAAALERRLRENGTPVERAGITWPGAKSAQLVVWREVPRGSNEVRRVEQIMAQSASGPIFNVVTFGPDAAFDDTQLTRSATTFVITK